MKGPILYSKYPEQADADRQKVAVVPGAVKAVVGNSDKDRFCLS